MFPFEVFSDRSFMEVEPDDDEEAAPINPFTGKPFETDDTQAIDGME